VAISNIQMSKNEIVRATGPGRGAKCEVRSEAGLVGHRESLPFVYRFDRSLEQKNIFLTFGTVRLGSEAGGKGLLDWWRRGVGDAGCWVLDLQGFAFFECAS